MKLNHEALNKYTFFVVISFFSGALFVAKVQESKQPTTLKTEAAFKNRYFIIAWYSGRSTGDIGYKTGTGLYPTHEELEKFIRDENKVEGSIIITFISEVNQADYHQYFKK